MDADFAAVLGSEFDANDGSFLLRLRTDLVWDKAAFARLERAMRAACEAYAAHDEIPRPLAEGFYYMATFVRSWTAHPNFPTPETGYYERCLARLDDLADWFFTGRSPYIEAFVWKPTE